MKIVTAEQMRQIDRECIERGTPANVLMENAGKAVAEETRNFLESLNDRHVLCLIGSGNNGGDGLVAARYLREWGAEVSVYLAAARSNNEDINLKMVQEKGILCIEVARDKDLAEFDGLLSRATCIIDGLLGTGRMRPLESVYKKMLERVNQTKRQRELKTIAIDLPSGMDADSGAVDPACLKADMTVTLAMPKAGLYVFPGAEMAGEVRIVDIGIPESLADSVNLELMTDAWAGETLPARPPDANKGTFGKVLVVAGSKNYIGAASLACCGTMRSGAGLVTLATPASLQPTIAAGLLETTYLPLSESHPGVVSANAANTILEQCGDYDVCLVGCGLGQEPATVEFVKSLVFSGKLPLTILDADALNIMSTTPDWWRGLPGKTVLTPHPGEMSRLCGLSVNDVQADRPGTVMKFAAEWQRTVVLKGAFTAVAAPDGRCRISPSANPGLATAGTGDVLAGCIAGLAAQGLSTFDAAALGVYLHGKAGERVRENFGDAGVIASDLLPELPVMIKYLKNADRNRS